MKRLIVIDGLDGCGKDTHALRVKRLMESEGGRVTVVSHPSGRLFGRLSKRALQGTGAVPRALATVFYTVDVLGSVRSYRRRKDGVVVFVRYLLGTAYLPETLAPMGYRFFKNLLPRPDLAVFIDIDPEVALRRIELRDHKREMFENREKLVTVRRIATGLTTEEWVVIDNTEDGEGPFEQLEEVLVARGMLRTSARVTPGRP